MDPSDPFLAAMDRLNVRDAEIPVPTLAALRQLRLHLDINKESNDPVRQLFSPYKSLRWNDRDSMWYQQKPTDNITLDALEGGQPTAMNRVEENLQEPVDLSIDDIASALDALMPIPSDPLALETAQDYGGAAFITDPQLAGLAAIPEPDNAAVQYIDPTFAYTNELIVEITEAKRQLQAYHDDKSRLSEALAHLSGAMAFFYAQLDSQVKTVDLHRQFEEDASAAARSKSIAGKVEGGDIAFRARIRGMIGELMMLLNETFNTMNTLVAPVDNLVGPGSSPDAET